jgi:hypothetical protein
MTRSDNHNDAFSHMYLFRMNFYFAVYILVVLLEERDIMFRRFRFFSVVQKVCKIPLETEYLPQS